MSETEFLTSDRLSLRPVEPDDYDFLQRHWNSAPIRRMTNQQTPLQREDIESKIESSDSSVFLLVVADDSPVGLIWLFDISHVNGRVEVGYWITDSAQGKGYATEALEAVTTYAFEELRLHKIVARVFAGNTPSIAVLERVGFEREGVVSEHYFVNGEFLDTYLFGLFASP
jgi:ribosomal-protein-alanine N-acetyltransferase